jgi:hypothetical protein
LWIISRKPDIGGFGQNKPDSLNITNKEGLSICRKMACRQSFFL